MASLEQIKADFRNLRDEVVDNENLLSVQMARLKDICGAGRLGVHVRNQIKDALLTAGIRHHPEELPNWQEAEIRLYIAGTDASRLLEAANQPGEANDEMLRQASLEGGDAARLIEQIKAILCK